MMNTHNHKYWWATFSNHPPEFIHAKGKSEAMAEAYKIGKVTTLKTLPYPPERSGVAPAFCYTPAECAGRLSCPKNHACSE